MDITSLVTAFSILFTLIGWASTAYSKYKERKKLIAEKDEAIKRLNSIIHPVDISAKKVTDTEKNRIKPQVLIATFSGMRYSEKMGVSEAEFHELLQQGDWQKLKVNTGTSSIGQTIKAIETYPSLKKIYLITTKSNRGEPSSITSVPLLKHYVAERLNYDCQIIADEDSYCVTMDADDHVVEETFNATKQIFESLGEEYDPVDSKVLVDISGGTQSMSMGALLASLRPDQNAHLIGVQYDETGKFIPNTSFPMIIKFIPEGLKETA